MSLFVKLLFFTLAMINNYKQSKATNEKISQFVCIDGMEIPLQNVCDGLPHCTDSSDETANLCRHISCPLTTFKCAYGACIPRSGQCNGFANCIDESDELFCENKNNSTDQTFRYFTSSEFISLSMLCDGLSDCIDKSDENVEICKNFNCPDNTFQYSFGECINNEIICDGINDCNNGSGEAKELCAAIIQNDTVSQKYCKYNEFSCKISEQCIPINSLCDGTYQCNDTTNEKSDIFKNQSCPKDYFRCAYGGCIHSSLRCNLYADCLDWSDEDENTCRNSLPVNACHLPPEKPGAWYTVANCKRCRPGSLVPELTRLEYNCYGNASIEGAKIVFCQDSHWFPSLPICLNDSNTIKCPAIISSGTIKNCEMKNSSKRDWIDCDQPALIGTRVTMECLEFYKRESGSSQVTCLHDGSWNQTPLRCRPNCGIKTPRLTTMIVKGWNTSPHEYIPWHATLFYLENGLWNFACGGTLIDIRIVLTAGHCLWKISPDTIKVFLSSNSSNFTNQNKEAQIVEVNQILLHNSYQDHEGNYGSDLALLILKNPAKINAYVLPACIDWTNSFDIDQRIGEIGFITGMGITENDTVSLNLRLVSAQVISEDVCRKKETQEFRKYLTYTSFCAGWANGSSVCNGDSGGGFILKRPNTSIWEVHGIVSLSPRRLGVFLCDPNYYTIFTKVSPYVSWIKRIVKSIE